MRYTSAYIASSCLIDLEGINDFRLAAELADESLDRAQGAVEDVVPTEDNDLLQHLLQSAVLDEREIRHRVQVDGLVNIVLGKQKFLKVRDGALGARKNVSSDEVQLNSKLLQPAHLIKVVDFRIQNLKKFLF